MKYELHLKLAGIPFTVRNACEETGLLCADYLTEAPPAFPIEITEELLETERECLNAHADAHGWKRTPYTAPELESNALYRMSAELLSAYRTILLHGSAVSLDGEAYLFVAPSGTGKSTHTRLWRQVFGDRAVMINDDKPLLRCTDGGIFVYGSPWNGKHHLGSNIAVPLKAICFLERGEENRIEPVSEKEAFLSLLKAVYHSQTAERETKILQTMQEIVKSAAFHRLWCGMTPEAAAVSYEGMKNRNEVDIP